MKIVQIIPGSGDNFYCENCVRDNGLVRALLKVGHDVVVVPMYLPQRIDKLDEVPDAPVFFGGINAYLQQKFAFFRKTPRWFDRVFDSKLLLGMAAKRAGSVRPSSLGEMTLSMLRGREGNQAKELERLLQWLQGMARPDLVHLSNPLLLGIGSEIKKRLGVPVVCSLQDEDTWIDSMPHPYLERCWEVLSESARGVDAFIAVSRYFSAVMQEKMNLDAGRLHVVHIGVESGKSAPSELPHAPPVIGYLARMSETLGLGILVEAFLKLKRTEPFRKARLHVSGGATADDRPFLAGLNRDLAARGVDGDVKIFEDFDPGARSAFLRTMTVLSIPAPGGVAFGTYVLESLASGVPVVLPRVGSFPELVEATGGGVLYDPNDSKTLARILEDLLSDRERLARLGREGRQSVKEKFNSETMAEHILDVYRSVLPAGGRES